MRGQQPPARFVRHRPVTGVVVAVLAGSLPDRGLELIPQPSRVLCRGEVHELILTTEEAAPGSRVDAISYLGFFEVKQGGVVVVGDDLRVRGSVIGEIAGFDATHLPNHLNVVVRGKVALDGLAWRFGLGDPVVIGGPAA
ncbi:MAG: hypothetical protein H5U04_00675 [Firmicutes bacterium]|nr:hypothetical protein [Bacillota bacterium]